MFTFCLNTILNRNPYIKVTGSVSVSLSKRPKNLANRCANLFKSPRKVLTMFGEVTTTLPIRIGLVKTEIGSWMG